MGAFVRVIASSERQEVAKQIAITVSESLVERMNDDDVIAVVESPAYSVKLAAIEVFVQVNKFKHVHAESLVEHVADDVEAWRQQNTISDSVNINVIPVEWYSNIGN